jgi:hypothetical protein
MIPGMTPIIIYSKIKSSRLTYVLDWLFTTRLQVPYLLTHNTDGLREDNFFIAYGTNIFDALTIPAYGLLEQNGISRQPICTDLWYDIPVLFAAVEEGDEDYILPFDMFSAIFFLLSRYEEYYTYIPDKHGRYPATESELYKQGWLRRPLVDEWVHLFRIMLETHMAIKLPEQHFSYTPTYDIDIAYSYLGKGLKRNIGGLAKDLLGGNMAVVKERTAVLLGSTQDPYDSFNFLAHLHKATHTQPLYFILCALSNSAFDKNILPTNPLMINLIKRLQKEGPVFIHPSYHAQGGSMMIKEKKELEKITGASITSSRQHYIKNKVPATYAQFLQQGITDDYSMGYATHIGFRAGTSHTFPWYDLEHETPTVLIIHPFCFMDTAAKYEEQLDSKEAFTALHLMATILKHNGGKLVTVFHNFSLGNDSQWKGWGESYKEFVEEFS